MIRRMRRLLAGPCLTLLQQPDNCCLSFILLGMGLGNAIFVMANGYPVAHTVHVPPKIQSNSSSRRRQIILVGLARIGAKGVFSRNAYALYGKPMISLFQQSFLRIPEVSLSCRCAVHARQVGIVGCSVDPPFDSARREEYCTIVAHLDGSLIAVPILAKQ